MKTLLNPSYLTLSKKDCTGCNACFNACPVKAISMQTDEEGFWYPHIDSNLCTECGACEQACPSLHLNLQLKTETPQVYAAWAKDDKLRISSTSGGIFSSLAAVIIEGGGHVFGARYRDDFSIEHYGASSLEELDRLKQSKYAQSDIGLIFREIKSLLENNQTVMFCGTPCHSAGLQNYLGQTYENLIICDFVCRGVNSPIVYKMYLQSLEEEYESSIKSVQFKNKDIGWNQFCTKVTFANGRTYLKDRENDEFMRGYLFYNLYLRPSCFACRYKTIPRISDISLADFWGVKCKLDSNQGTSLVLLNTEKGRSLFSDERLQIMRFPSSLEEAVPGNTCLFSSVSDLGRRDHFFKTLRRTHSFTKTMLQYPKNGNAKHLRVFLARARLLVHQIYSKHFSKYVLLLLTLETR